MSFWIDSLFNVLSSELILLAFWFFTYILKFITILIFIDCCYNLSMVFHVNWLRPCEGYDSFSYLYYGFHLIYFISFIFSLIFVSTQLIILFFLSVSYIQAQIHPFHINSQYICYMIFYYSFSDSHTERILHFILCQTLYKVTFNFSLIFTKKHHNFYQLNYFDFLLS